MITQLQSIIVVKLQHNILIFFSKRVQDQDELIFAMYELCWGQILSHLDVSVWFCMLSSWETMTSHLLLFDVSSDSRFLANIV